MPLLSVSLPPFQECVCIKQDNSSSASTIRPGELGERPDGVGARQDANWTEWSEQVADLAALFDVERAAVVDVRPVGGALVPRIFAVRVCVVDHGTFIERQRPIVEDAAAVPVGAVLGHGATDE